MDMASLYPCKDKNGDFFSFGDVNTIEIEEKTLEPFNTYEFTLTGKKGLIENSNKVALSITELGKKIFNHYI